MELEVEQITPHDLPKAKPLEVKHRLFEPFNRIQLLVYTRKYAMNADGEVAPFTCRFRAKYQLEMISVYDLIMPARTDVEGEPILRYMDSERYFEITHTKQLRASLSVIINEASYHNLLRVEESLKIEGIL